MEKKKNELSILIPVYNTVCVDLVQQLQRQANDTGADYEIIVADDASTIQEFIAQNKSISVLPNCEYILKEKNTGAASTRNFLAQRSRYHWLLFLDCDMKVPNSQFLSRYLSSIPTPVVNGGISIGGDKRMLHSNLRYLYEKSEEPNHTAQQRQLRPYQSFRSTNFLIEREVMLKHPFDERFRRSGYEDVLFGKQLRLGKIAITHIDNPLLMTDFEENPAYMEKIERSLQTLYTFRHDLQGYSRLLALHNGIHISVIRSCVRLFHRLFKNMERRILCGSHPNLTLFKLYRMGYYFTLNK